MTDKSAEIPKNFEYSPKTNPFLVDLDMSEVNSYTNPQEAALAELMIKMGLKPENYLYSGFYGKGRVEKILKDGHVFDPREFNGEVFCFDFVKKNASEYEFNINEVNPGPFHYAMGMQNEGQIDEAIAVYDKREVVYDKETHYVAQFRSDPKKALRGVIKLVNW